MTAPTHRPAPDVRLRPGRPADLDLLVELEQRVFGYDQVSRQSFRRFLGSRSARVIVAEHDGAFAGYALVLFRPNSRIARLYSIAAAATGRGIGPMLLTAAEDAARRRRCQVMRLEVHETNAAAIRRYERSGYILRGRRPGYYTDGATALRFEKPLAIPSPLPPDRACRPVHDCPVDSSDSTRLPESVFMLAPLFGSETERLDVTA